MLKREAKGGSVNCEYCGKELYDNGEERFQCPYCGADVESVRNETLEERCRRLERELARQRMKAEIEEQSASDHFWDTDTIVSMNYRQSAREALARGDMESAKRYMGKAEKAMDMGCVLHVLVPLIVFLIVLFLVAMKF